MFKKRNRYAIITIDTEAQPKRAEDLHVKRLIWGEHLEGTAGVREMCAAADAVNAKLVFFVDSCGVYLHGKPFEEAARWLNDAGHDVQLHTHSEFLPDEFWINHGFNIRPRMLNQYDEERSIFTIKFFSEYLAEIIGKPILAFRAGSFRWNWGTLKAQSLLGLPMSFNNSMRAYTDKVCPFGVPRNEPFLWSNGILEVPVTERRFPSGGNDDWWGRLAFPCSKERRSQPWKVLLPYTIGRNTDFLNVLLHSWSLLYWDDRGYGVYKDERREEDFNRLMKKISKDYDIITATDMLDLYKSGLIKIEHSVEIPEVSI